MTNGTDLVSGHFASGICIPLLQRSSQGPSSSSDMHPFWALILMSAMGGKRTPPLQQRLAQLTIVLHKLRLDAFLDVRKGPDTELDRLAVQSLLKDV